VIRLALTRRRRLAPGIFGLIIAVIIATNITTPKDGTSTYSLFSGYAHLGSGLTVGLSNLATGLAMGMAGEIGVQDSARQPKLYIGMVRLLATTSHDAAPIDTTPSPPLLRRRRRPRRRPRRRLHRRLHRPRPRRRLHHRRPR